MEYTIRELLAYLFIYGFLGWVTETVVMAVRKRRFCNRGLLNFPVCLSYGIMFVILIILFPTLQGKYIMQFITAGVVVSVVEFLSGVTAKNICKKELWQYESNTMFGVEKKGTLISLGVTAMVVLTMHILHPVIFMAVHIIPGTVIMIIDIVLVCCTLIDFITIIYVVGISKNTGDIEKVKAEKLEGKVAFGKRISDFVTRRLYNAYPGIKDKRKTDGNRKFARGICFDKMVWVFLICSFGGDIIETVFCRITAGVWMSRSSVIYGAFSIVWGLAAVLLTLVLQKMANKEDRYVFVAGCVLGGVYEYACSVFTEVFFGTVFWDYSHMKFNIGGRINLLYCIFWGIVAVIWIKICYPVISRLIEKIPRIPGKIATWFIIIFMVCNAMISAAALGRYVDRKAGEKADNVIEEFIDYHYPDKLVERVWPNMKVK